MAAIHSSDTLPEKYIRSLFFSKGYRFRKNYSALPGSPDIWLKKYNTVVFVHGCFWHRHQDCKYAYSPRTRAEFWSAKFEANILRDKIVYQNLREQGMRCLVIWECLIKKMKTKPAVREAVWNSIEVFLLSEDLFLEMGEKDF